MLPGASGFCSEAAQGPVSAAAAAGVPGGVRSVRQRPSEGAQGSRSPVPGQKHQPAQGVH